MAKRPKPAEAPAEPEESASPAEEAQPEPQEENSPASAPPYLEELRQDIAELKSELRASIKEGASRATLERISNDLKAATEALLAQIEASRARPPEAPKPASDPPEPEKPAPAEEKPKRTWL